MIAKINVACPTCFENTAMSSLKDSDEQTSPPVTDGSLGVQVASSHFSKISARRGNRGCLEKIGIFNLSKSEITLYLEGQNLFYKFQVTLTVLLI